MMSSVHVHFYARSIAIIMSTKINVLCVLFGHDIIMFVYMHVCVCICVSLSHL